MGRSKSRNVGVIGLGIIGSRVAAQLRHKGLRVYVWNRTPRPEQNFLGSVAELAEICQIVQIFVADDEALLGIAGEISPSLGANHIVTAHCTVAPSSMRAAAEMVQRRGARFLDAPFTGSKVAAEKGQLVYYIGGDEDALAAVRPILEKSSKEVLHVGGIGDASVIKVATNMVTAATAEVGAEAMAIIKRAGLSTELFSQAMKHNASNSLTLEMKLPKIAEGDYEPHFSVKHMLKDVRIAARLAEQFQLELPVTEKCTEILLQELKRGRGDADYSAVASRYFPASQKVTKSTTEAPPLPAEPMPENGFSAGAQASIVHELKSEEDLARSVEVPYWESSTKEPSAQHETIKKPKEESPANREETDSLTAEPKASDQATDQEKNKEEEEFEGVNLSGGFRGWLTRRWH